MSKPYITRFLPVEGEIKRGDMFQYPGMPVTYCTGRDDGLIWYELLGMTSASCDPGDCWRMALHFVTYDITPGDKLKECLSDGIEREVHHFEAVPPAGIWVLKPWPSQDEKWIGANMAFRVIGLVSPAATWIREGGCYGEDEIRRIAVVRRKDGLSIHPDRFRIPMSSWLRSSFNTREHDVTEEIEVKCPCCGSFK